MQHLLKDDTELFKQFVDNESFKRFVGDMVYALTSAWTCSRVRRRTLARSIAVREPGSAADRHVRLLPALKRYRGRGSPSRARWGATDEAGQTDHNF